MSVMKIIRNVIFLVATMLATVIVVKQTFGANLFFDTTLYSIGALSLIFIMLRPAYTLITLIGAGWLAYLWYQEQVLNMPEDFRMYKLNSVYIFLAGWAFYVITKRLFSKRQTAE